MSPFSPEFLSSGSPPPQGEGPATPPAPGEGNARTSQPGTPGTGTTQADDSGGSITDSLLMFALIGAVIYFLIFAPERKARKKRQTMLDAVKKGDRIVTTGGLHAQVAELRDHEVVLKAGETRLTYSRSAIHEVLEPKTAKGD